MVEVVDFLEMEYEEEAEQFSYPCPACTNAKLEIKVDILLDDSVQQKTAKCNSTLCGHGSEVKIDNYFMHKAFHREGEEYDSASESEDGGELRIAAFSINE